MKNFIVTQYIKPISSQHRESSSSRDKYSVPQPYKSCQNNVKKKKMDQGCKIGNSKWIRMHKLRVKYVFFYGLHSP